MTDALAKRNPPKTAAGTVGVAAAVLAVAAVAGAGIGLAAAKPCPTDPTSAANLMCGKGWGAWGGALLGLGVAGIGGVTVAAFSKDWRPTGMTTSGVGFVAFLATGVAGSIVARAEAKALAQKTQGTSSSTSSTNSTTA